LSVFGDLAIIEVIIYRLNHGIEIFNANLDGTINQVR